VKAVFESPVISTLIKGLEAHEAEAVIHLYATGIEEYLTSDKKVKLADVLFAPSHADTNGVPTNVS